jgi:hypothetical protein
MTLLNWETSVLFNKSQNLAKFKPSLLALGSNVLKPSLVGISSYRCRAYTKETTCLFEAKLRVQESLNELLSALFEFASVVICGYTVVIE